MNSNELNHQNAEKQGMRGYLEGLSIADCNAENQALILVKGLRQTNNK